MPICGNENSNDVVLVEKEEEDTQKNTSTWTIIDNKIEENTIHMAESLNINRTEFM